jgi:hypothetical protein
MTIVTMTSLKAPKQMTIPKTDTLTQITDGERAAMKTEARAYIAKRLRENLKLFEAHLLAIRARHGKPATAEAA